MIATDIYKRSANLALIAFLALSASAVYGQITSGTVLR